MSPASQWLRRLFTDGHFFFALKVLLAMASLLLAGWWLEQVPAAVTLSLGAMAGALSETDQRPGRRLGLLLLGLLCFFVAITGVTALIDIPWLFGPVLVLVTFGLILAGAWGQAAGKLGFGILLVSIYAMQGHVDSPGFWYQPILLTAGAAWYGLCSWLVLLAWPYKPVHEQLAQCYFALSRYLLAKSRFFDSPDELHQGLRHQLAQLNIQLVNNLELSKQILNRRLHGGERDAELARLLELHLLVQGMHERAASSHYSYQQLNQALERAEVLAGYQILLAELGEACYRLGLAILTHRPYQSGRRIAWELSALKDQLDYSHLRRHYSPELMSPLRFLTRNMEHVHQALLRAEALTARDGREAPTARAELARPAPQSFGERLRALLNPNAILFRHGVRLSACFALGYGLVTALELERGYWILLTILFVCQPSFSATRQRLTERTLGTLAGIAAGAPLLWLFPSVESQLVILLVCAFVFFTQVRVHYSWAVCFITLFVLLAFNLQGIARDPVLLPRLLDTLAGCALAFVAVWFIWPDWQRRHLPRLLADAMEANAGYLCAISHQGDDMPPENLAYRIARKQAHLADNQLAQAWQNIRVEPVSKHWLNLCFEIAYRNHTLLSYLSALGAHRQGLPDAFVNGLNQRLCTAADALRRGVPLPAQPPLPAMVNSSEDEWQILTRQLHNNMALLVNDLYQLAGGVREDAQDTALE
ncbi:MULTISPECIES: YccS family putative transporter [Oceanimonas]|uniref:TIGR01666 family membrane protein n=1 Tax=Oceanimonas doudoroffii TaxID=84158 RepID=A0A233RFA9_9GAMM|nr:MULTISPECIES: YccS family putative transporter [Oceanimonas]NHI01576.1 Inner membrane protein YccS [Oceanimonas sp. MB9]OXY82066.1 TIGR01666 family membrane protein [Oceanimonas doudoroffii]